MHNLFVLRGCEVVFDSQDQPEELLKALAPSHDVQARNLSGSDLPFNSEWSSYIIR
jgi:hypothetical protein